VAEEKKKEEKEKVVGNDFIWGKDSSVQGSGSVKSINNRIYYYEYVSHNSILNLTEQVQTVTKKMQILGIENEIEPPPITLHIGSYGGSVFAGFAGMDMIKSNILPIHTVVDGAAASAATLLSVVGSRRLIRKNAYMLIHQLSSCLYGKFEEIKDDMQNLERMMATIKQTYIDHARIPKDKLDDMLKHDWWLPADECLRLGLVDEIIE
jgi:ATP-dependent protease ClpP protease subunit